MKPVHASYVLLALIPASLIACGEDSSTAPSTQMDVPIIGGYSITVPATYKNVSGTGIDSYSFQVYRNDGKVVYRVELGPGTLYERAQFEELPATDRYPNRILFESASGQKGAYYYQIIPEQTFRSIDGVVVFDAASGAGFEEVFFTSHSEDSMPEVLETLRTLRH